MISNMKEIERSSKLTNFLPAFVFIVFALQPLLDILSYWTGVLEMGNALTLLLRFGVLGVVALLGFCVSQRKKAYFLAAAVVAALFAGHAVVCFSVGYQNIITDATNFIRVIQMPLFAFCFISFMRANDKCFRAVENALIVNFWIITVSVVISVVTGTQNPTYQQTGFGLLGWFATSNAQSAVLSLLAPIVICLCIYRKKNLAVFIATVAASFVQLYLVGTRLAFLAIFVTVAGVLMIMILTKKFSMKYALVLVAGLVLCCAFFKQSPMYLNQAMYIDVMADKQSDAVSMMEEAATSEDQTDTDQEKLLHALRVVYRHYSRRLCQRFGVDVVMEKYNYTSTISELTAVRNQKITFCKLLMDEHPFLARLFGMELDRMTFDGYVFDVENDFHGIFFLYGAAGLALMILFLLYFLFLIARALIKDFKTYFTLQTGAYGMGLCMCLVYAYFTAGMLRRPNSSFYLSIMLAVVYYLVKIKKNAAAGDKKEPIEQ